MQEADNITRIFRETKQAINEEDFTKINQLSNQTIHSATISQDPDNIIVAVVIYSISKIISREHYKDMPGWSKFYASLLKSIDKIIQHLENNEIKKTREALGRIRNSINSIDSELKDYIKEVFKKAEINKAFKIYEHGLSAEQTANLLGVSLWDLSSYIGQSSVSESRISETMPVKKRVKIAEDIFS